MIWKLVASLVAIIIILETIRMEHRLSFYDARLANIEAAKP